MPKSNAMSTKIINYFCRQETISPTSQPQLYLALYVNNPTGADTGTEASYTGYARQPVTFSVPYNVGEAIAIETVAEIQFPPVPENSGSISFAALRTAETDGELIYFGELATTFHLNEGVQPVIPTGGLVVVEV